MKYSKLIEIYEALESTTKKLEKADILANFYKSCPSEQLYRVVLLSMGAVVSKQEDLGIASEMMKRIIMKAYGVDDKDLTRRFKETGDLGETAKYFAQHRKQVKLGKRELTIDNIFENISKLPGITGGGSQERKVDLVVDLLSNADPDEALYIVRTILGEMRIGVAHGIVRDAIAKAFDQDVREIEKTWNIILDFGKVAEMAKKGKLEAEIEIGRPLHVMLADSAPDLKSALEEFENPAIETKLDGFRAAIHKDGNKIKIFSRRLDDVSNQFPEVAEWAKENIKAKTAIVEGEIIAVDHKTGLPKPFQQLSRRIQRKYDIEKMVKEIPVRIDLFELVYLNGQSWMNHTLRDRWKKLNEIISEKKNKFQLIDHIETKDFDKANKFYQDSLALGEEGVIVKNLDAHYQAGRRVGYWLKVKPIMEPLDLVIVGAEWGTGKRGKWLGSLILAARHGKEFLPTGMMGSGLTEEQLEDVTKRLKKLIEKEHGRVVEVKPEIVVEIGYEEIQKSPKYPTGYALRFPRLIRFREDKGPQDANTLKDIERLFGQQKKRR